MYSVTNLSMSRRALIAGLGGFAVAGSAHGQTPIASPVPPMRIPKLRVGVASLAYANESASHFSLDAMWLGSLLYDAPFAWNASAKIIPALFGLAAGSSGASVGLRVNAGVMTHAGIPVTLDHLAQTLTRLQRSSQSWRLQFLEDIALIDDTLWIRFDRPDMSLPATLAHPAMAVTVGDDGTGPFVLTDSTPGIYTYTRNNLFWQVSRPHIDALEVVEIADDSQRSTAMATGELDILPNVPLLDVPMLENEPAVYLVGGPGNRVCHLQVRTDVAPLSDPRVRQILSAAIDRKSLVTIATANQADPAFTLFAPDSWIQDADSVEEISASDVRRMLRELGLPSEIRLQLLADNADSTQANTAVVLQDQMANCGISLGITLLEGQELADAKANGDFQLLVGYSEPWRDPHELVWPLLSTGGSNNWSGFASPEVDTLLRAAIVINDTDFRIGRYSRLEYLIQREVPVIPLFRPFSWDAISVKYPGYEALPAATSRGLMTLLTTTDR